MSDGPFDRRALQRTIVGFLGGDCRGDALVRQLLMISLWYQACVRDYGSRRSQPVGAP